jgi:hypothetical protein
MIVTMASEWPQQDHAPATLDQNAEKSARRAGGRRLQAFDRRQIKCRSDIVNYPATLAFSKST